MLSGQFFEIAWASDFPGFRRVAIVSCTIIDGGLPDMAGVVGASPPISIGPKGLGGEIGVADRMQLSCQFRE